jgi:hypothetical protein
LKESEREKEEALKEKRRIAEKVCGIYLLVKPNLDV